ncbi:hypothetical protein C8N46_106324 [Kordia periserrulae]|uniref:Uncharacterized protein n=1 Tax=Kordia periserrulae TaxID=701523 RepID=A0A2T6BX79_9FLAO|nr:hypothetical protein [Kordia periserrulae]PTX60678.1 hypothetical protein C8N46_106324 [Kordia periserrulae]
MYLHQIEIPNASAILYMNHYDSYGFSMQELLFFHSFLFIPAFFDILINRYQDHLEFLINVSKTDDETIKLMRMNSFYALILSIKDIEHDTIENSYQFGTHYDYLTVKCKLNAINK